MARKTTKTEQNILTYLNELRESGITNMYGALPYVEDEFENESKQECKRCLMLWMKNFNDEGEYEEVEDQAYKVK